MKVAHLIPALVKGGAEKVVVDLANCGVVNGDDITLILSHPSPPHLLAHELRPDVKIRYISDHQPGQWMRYARLAPWLWRNWAEIRRLDVLHCHLSLGSAAATLARWVARIKGDPRPAIVETIHAVGMPVAKWKLRLLAGLAPRRDAIALVAEDSFWRRFKARNPAALVCVIPNGIALRKDRPMELQRRAYRARIGIPGNCSCIVGTLGRLVAERKPEYLIRTFAEISRAGRGDVHFVMGGAGPCLETLEKLAKEMGLEEQIHFPGLVVDSSLFFSILNLYITVNVGPITGVAGLEAAAQGIPLIALQAREDYEGGIADWIWSAPEPREVAAEAVRLLGRPAELGRLAEQQRRHVTEHQSAETMTLAYADLYRRALDRIRPRARSKAPY